MVPGDAIAAANGCPGFRAKTIASYTYARSIVVTGTTCLDAELVIRNFYSQEIGSSGSTYALGYGCAYRGGGNRVLCTKAEQRIRWHESDSPPPPLKVRKCGGITFTPRTEDGVSRIRARRVSCRKARRVARGANGRGPSGVDGARFSYRRLRFQCRGLENATALPIVRWRCTRGQATITFTKA